ncbi:unnamed protein product [Brassica oleracea var. botrytis]|nr:peptidyl-prolyl cis-trans isomerase FKBP12-like [Brassica napus]KAH0900256.1 hypothetical protein HID58_049824 [Brassica napus]CAF1921826.1 unnamed protein product [Brassica napus]
MLLIKWICVLSFLVNYCDVVKPKCVFGLWYMNSTKDAGRKPFSFQIGKGAVIKGWDEGVMGMQIGEVARLRCSPDYAYGAGGFPAWGIQPNSVLDFEIEVLSVQ